MHPVNLLIFDLDGTLVNTLEDITASLNYTLSKFGRQPLPMDRVRRYVGDGLTALLQRALGERREFLDQAQAVYTVHYSRNLSRRSRLYPGVRETLEHFKGLPMAVISNKSSEFIGPLLGHFGILPYFKEIVGADSGLLLKPAPDALLRVMAAFNAPGDRTVMVGDGTTDIRAGKAAGCITCAAAYGFRSEGELREAGPDHLIQAFSELKDLFVPAPSG